MTTLLTALATLLGGAGDPDDGFLGLPLAMSLDAPLPRGERPLPASLAEGADEEFPEEDAGEAEAPQDEDEPQDAPKPRLPKFEEPPREPYRYEPPHGSLFGFFRTHFSAQGWEENVYRDYLTTSSVLLPLSFAAAAGLVSPWDDSIQSSIEGSFGHRARVGNLSMYSVMAGGLALGLLFPQEGHDPWDVLWEQAESYLIVNLLTTVLKVGIGRKRPHGDSDRSFPSSHAANAFTAAALVQENSGWGFGAPAYGLAGLTGYSRIEAGRHYPSDVLAGAAIGILTVGILDALHWGNHGKGRGIAAADGGPHFDFAFEPGRDFHLELGITLGF